MNVCSVHLYLPCSLNFCACDGISVVFFFPGEGRPADGVEALCSSVDTSYVGAPTTGSLCDCEVIFPFKTVVVRVGTRDTGQDYAMRCCKGGNCVE